MEPSDPFDANAVTQSELIFEIDPQTVPTYSYIDIEIREKREKHS